MRVEIIRVSNYGPFAALAEVRLGSLATIIGQNDTGKSNILRALQVFFDKRKLEEGDVHSACAATDDVIIELSFTSLPPQVELESGVSTTLKEEMLLDDHANFRIRKTYPRQSLAKYTVSLITVDFGNELFAGLPALKESDLNELCAAVDIEVTKSGRGITNKAKRAALRSLAQAKGVDVLERALVIATKDDLWKRLAALLPEFVLFETDTKLSVDETSFQSQFRPIIRQAAEEPNVLEAKEAFTGAIGKALQSEIEAISNYLQQHTATLSALTARPEFLWDKAVTFDIRGRDQYGVETSLERRGSGVQRLLMVAFFQYLAERQGGTGPHYVFAVEEPENCLHPGLQRELVRSFRRLADAGYQIIVTSHSPVFAGASPVEDLALVVRQEGEAKAIQSPGLDLADVAVQLGVEPSDQVSGYRACIFVEGPSDIEYWTAVARELKAGMRVANDFNDRQIGFVPCGGETLKHWIDLRAMARLNRHFGVVVDSDRACQEQGIPERKVRWQEKCQEQGGLFFILRKREMENYLHPEAIKRLGLPDSPFGDFDDMKALFGPSVYKAIGQMSCDEILACDRYDENGVEHHETEEIVQALLALAGN